MIYVHPIIGYITFFISLISFWSVDPFVNNMEALEHEKGEDKITLTTYNVWALPAALPGHDQPRRFHKLPDQIAGISADIIALQEVFRPNIKKKIAKRMHSKNYHISTDSDEQSRKLLGFLEIDNYGGLMTLSCYPILADTFLAYPLMKDMNIEEKWARKGFLITKIQTQEGPLLVINTHLYAGKSKEAETFRMRQIEFMMNYLANTIDYYRYPAFLVGDINITHPIVAQRYADLSPSIVYEALINMDFCDASPVIQSDEMTIDPVGNAYKSKEKHSQKLDYCFYHIPEKDCRNAIDIMNAYRLFTTPETCLSDHYGWSTELRIISTSVEN